MNQSPNDKRHARLELEARNSQFRQALYGKNRNHLSIAEALENATKAEERLRRLDENP
jgi:hypothetical protein